MCTVPRTHKINRHAALGSVDIRDMPPQPLRTERVAAHDIIRSSYCLQRVSVADRSIMSTEPKGNRPTGRYPTMAFFNFGKKLETGKQFSLADIPVFSSLNPAELRLIEKKACLQEFKRSDLVYKEGTAAEFFYVVISGRFHIFTESRVSHVSETLLHLYRGDHFGETSLLTGKLHSASVQAKSDGVVLRLAKEDFLRFVDEIPSLLHYLTRSLGHRLTKSVDSHGTRREVKITALYPAVYPQEAFVFWMDLSSRLVREAARKVIVVDFSGKEPPHFAEEFQTRFRETLNLKSEEPPSENLLREATCEHPGGFFYLSVDVEQKPAEGEKKISQLLTFLTYRYDYIMLRLPPDVSHASFQVLKQTDLVYLFCVAEAIQLNTCSQVLEMLQKEYGFGKSDIKVILYERIGSTPGFYEESEKCLGFPIFSVLPSKAECSEKYHGTVRFLAREVSEKLIGLALGSGAAYGLSHIGLLKVLEREKIPVDVIAGASIGALIGGFWAAGFDAAQLEQIARSINKTNGFFKLLGFRDLSLAHRGFFKGNQLTRFLESYAGNMTFQDLRMPVKIIATDLFTSEEIVLESGRIVDAIRASSSIPGIFRPAHYRGRCLIDGGVIDPLPVKVLARMGVKKIIAANVLSSPADRVFKSRIDETKRIHELRELAHKGPIRKSLDALFYKLKKRYADNTLNVIMSTIQFMEYELATAAAQECDVLLHPEVFDGHWAEFYNPDPFILAGEQCALKHLDAIKQLLKE